MTRYYGNFNDAAVYDPTTKTAVSVRDGVLEYLGEELNIEPADKIVTVYRSPATIANAAAKMPGIPITDGHVDIDMPPPASDGYVAESSMIDASDPVTKTTIAVKNLLTLSDTLTSTVDAGRRELSLGYRAELVPHDGDYDFEQRDIVPHHLATVDRGRCGPMCSFIDKKPDGDPDTMIKNKLHAAFCDAEGAMNLQQIVELSTALPEAIKSVPVDQLQKLLPALQQIVEAAKGVGAEMPEPDAPAEDEQVPETETEDMEHEDMSAEEKEKQFSDAVAAAAAEQSKKMTDEAIKTHTIVIQKARDFLPEDYAFADKSTDQIMRDALATDTAEPFADSELPLAFKMLKKPAKTYQEFGDKNPCDLTSIANQEL